MRVLVHEENAALRVFLAKTLSLRGYSISCTDSNLSLLAHLQRQVPDLLILSVDAQKAPDMELLAAVKGTLPHTAILVLTPECKAECRVRCFELGADDCMQKPFDFHELAARSDALLRRLTIRTELKLQVCGLELDLIQRTVKHKGQTLELTRKEFCLLECLARRGGLCCSREELLREVWRTESTSSTNVVDVYINYLRKKIASILRVRHATEIIETVRGNGYRLNLALATSQSETPLPLSA